MALALSACQPLAIAVRELASPTAATRLNARLPAAPLVPSSAISLPTALVLRGTIVFPSQDGKIQLPDNIRVELLNESGQVLQTTRANPEGTYNFANLDPGKRYHLKAIALQNPLLALEALVDTPAGTPDKLDSQGLQKNVSLRTTALTLLHRLAQQKQSPLARLSPLQLEAVPEVAGQILELNQVLLQAIRQQNPLLLPLGQQGEVQKKLTETLTLLENLKKSVPAEILASLPPETLFKPSEPALAWVAPNQGFPNTSVRIGISSSEKLNLSQIEIRFNGEKGELAQISGLEHTSQLDIVSVNVPEKATSGPLYVSLGNKALKSEAFTVQTIPQASPSSSPNISVDWVPQFIPAPTIASVAPAGGTFGDTVTLTGVALDQVYQVQVNGTPATLLSVGGGEIKIKVPPGSTTGKITAVASGATGVSQQDFTVIPDPYVFKGFVTGLLGTDTARIRASNAATTSLVTGNGAFSLSIPGQFPLPTLNLEWANRPLSICLLPPFLCPAPAPPWGVTYTAAVSNGTIFNLSWPRLDFSSAVLTVVGADLEITNANLLYPLNPGSLFTVTFLPGNQVGTVTLATETQLTIAMPGGTPPAGQVRISLPGQAAQVLTYPS